MNIYGKKVIMRALEPEDMPYLLEMINDPEMERMVIGWSFPNSVKEQNDWYQKVISDKKNLRFAVQLIETGQFLGVSTLVKIDWKNRSADYGIKLCSTTPKKQGIGFDVVYATMKYAFEELQLNRLYSSILDYNIASKKLFEKCGWKYEGCYKQSVFKNNTYHDEYPIAILRSEYCEWKEGMEKKGII